MAKNRAAIRRMDQSGQAVCGRLARGCAGVTSSFCSMPLVRRRTTDVGYSPSQPVPYSHQVHVGKMGMDCRYCHTTVEGNAFAAVPPTSRLYELPQEHCTGHGDPATASSKHGDPASRFRGCECMICPITSISTIARMFGGMLFAYRVMGELTGWSRCIRSRHLAWAGVWSAIATRRHNCDQPNSSRI